MHVELVQKKTEFPQTRSLLICLSYAVDLGSLYQQHNANIN